MSKTDRHKKDLVPLFVNLPNKLAEEKIIQYILANSNLPGRRANLELAKAFAETIAEESSVHEPKTLWQFCYRLTEISIEEGPVNNPREFLPFCGTCGLGAIGAANLQFFSDALVRLRTLATNARWRMREAVRMALQRLLTEQPSTTQQQLEQWGEEDNWLVLRAVAASTGEQCIKMDESYALWALNLHKIILSKLIASEERSSEEFKALRKGLAYTLSIVVQSVPVEGFSYLNELAGEQDRDAVWIVKQNLKKKRLSKNYPKKVKAVEKLLH
ncbi:MAG: hypothetical protein ACXAB4_02990 [Candidatus Hodarchaeales archaeon]|jgi:hypothetical protein